MKNSNGQKKKNSNGHFFLQQKNNLLVYSCCIYFDGLLYSKEGECGDQAGISKGMKCADVGLVVKERI